MRTNTKSQQFIKAGAKKTRLDLQYTSLEILSQSLTSKGLLIERIPRNTKASHVTKSDVVLIEA